MKKFVKKLKGFTLVELMIAAVISIGLVTVGISSVNSFNNKQKVDSTTNEIAGMVRLAKNYAVTMQSPGGYSGTEYVGLIISNTGLITIVPGNNTTGLSLGTTYTSKQIDLSSVNISSVGSGVLLFSMPQGKLLQFVGASNKTEPRSSDSSVNILIRSKQDPSVENGVLIKSSGIIDERANQVTGGVPSNALANDKTLITLFPATSTPIPPQVTCASNNMYVSMGAACLGVCNTKCTPGICVPYSTVINGVTCYGVISKDSGN